MRAAFLVTFVGLFTASVMAGDIDVVDQRYINQLTQGGATSIKQAAQSIYNAGETDTEVLDVAAEVLLSRYATGESSDIDALVWVCRALGNTGSSRYFSVLQEVSEEAPHEKLRMYAKQSLVQVGSGGTQYLKGSINLAALRNSIAPAASAAVP